MVTDKLHCQLGKVSKEKPKNLIKAFNLNKWSSVIVYYRFRRSKICHICSVHSVYGKYHICSY